MDHQDDFWISSGSAVKFFEVETAVCQIRHVTYDEIVAVFSPLNAGNR